MKLNVICIKLHHKIKNLHFEVFWFLKIKT